MWTAGIRVLRAPCRELRGAPLQTDPSHARNPPQACHKPDGSWEQPHIPRGDLQATFVFKGYDEASCQLPCICSVVCSRSCCTLLWSRHAQRAANSRQSSVAATWPHAAPATPVLSTLAAAPRPAPRSQVRRLGLRQDTEAAVRASKQQQDGESEHGRPGNAVVCTPCRTVSALPCPVTNAIREAHTPCTQHPVCPPAPRDPPTGVLRERPGSTGMLVVESVVPGGPADGQLEPGDVLVGVERGGPRARLDGVGRGPASQVATVVGLPRLGVSGAPLPALVGPPARCRWLLSMVTFCRPMLGATHHPPPAQVRLNGQIVTEFLTMETLLDDSGGWGGARPGQPLQPALPDLYGGSARPGMAAGSGSRVTATLPQLPAASCRPLGWASGAHARLHELSAGASHRRRPEDTVPRPLPPAPLAVGGSVKVEVERGGVPLTADIRVQDLHAGERAAPAAPHCQLGRAALAAGSGHSRRRPWPAHGSGSHVRSPPLPLPKARPSVHAAVVGRNLRCPPHPPPPHTPAPPTPTPAFPSHALPPAGPGGRRRE